MEKISIKKQMAIIRQYLNKLSFKEIATKENVSVGTVANVINGVKAGEFPELAEVADQVEALREIGGEIRKSNLSLSQCAVAIAILTGLQDLGLEPGDVLRCVAVCRSLTPGSVEQRLSSKQLWNIKPLWKELVLTSRSWIIELRN